MKKNTSWLTSGIAYGVWLSWCHCHSLSLASVKSRLVLRFWYRLTRAVPDKGPLNGCVHARVCVCVSWVEIRSTWWRRRTKGQVCVWCHDATFYVALFRAIMSNVFFTNWGAKHKKTLLTPCNRPAKGGWLWSPRQCHRNMNVVARNGGADCRWGGWKSATFDNTRLNDGPVSAPSTTQQRR